MDSSSNWTVSVVEEAPVTTTRSESQLSVQEDYIVAGYLAIVWVISIYANGVVLLGLGRQKHRPQPIDWAVGNLAISNGILALVTYPLMLVSLFSHKWIFYKIGCVAYAFITLFFGLVSIWTLLGVAGILLSTTESDAKVGRRKLHNRWIRWFLGFIYVLSFVFCFLPLVGLGEYGPGKHGTSCTINWSSKMPESPIYITCLMIFGFFVPLLGTAILYGGVIRNLRSFKERYTNPNFGKRWATVQYHTFCMSIAVCVCMIGCWTPYSIVSMWETYGDPSSLPMRLEAVSALMAKSSTAMSPLVQLCFASKFRGWLKSPFCCVIKETRCRIASFSQHRSESHCSPASGRSLRPKTLNLLSSPSTIGSSKGSSVVSLARNSVTCVKGNLAADEFL